MRLGGGLLQELLRAGEAARHVADERLGQGWGEGDGEGEGWGEGEGEGEGEG